MIKKLNTLKKSNHYFHKRYTSTGHSFMTKNITSQSFMPQSSVGMSVISSGIASPKSRQNPSRKSKNYESKINALNNYISNYENVPILEPYQTKRSQKLSLDYRQKKYRIQIGDVMRKKMREIEDRLTIEKSGSQSNSLYTGRTTTNLQISTARKTNDLSIPNSIYQSELIVSHRTIENDD